MPDDTQPSDGVPEVPVPREEATPAAVSPAPAGDTDEHEARPPPSTNAAPPKRRARGKPRNWKHRLVPSPAHGYEVCAPWHPKAALDALWDFSDAEEDGDG